MIKKSILLTAMAIAMAVPTQAQWLHEPTPNDTLQSVRRLANGDVVLSIYAPKAQSVNIAGDIMPWGQKLEVKKADNGVWSVTVPQVKDGVYRYHFVVDGVSVYDPVGEEAKETSALAYVSRQKEHAESFNLKSIATKVNKNFKQFVFTQGGPEDIAYKNCKDALKYLDEAGIKYEFKEAPGGHTWYTWRNNLYDLAPKLFK